MSFEFLLAYLPVVPLAEGLGVWARTAVARLGSVEIAAEGDLLVHDAEPSTVVGVVLAAYVEARHLRMLPAEVAGHAMSSPAIQNGAAESGLEVVLVERVASLGHRLRSLSRLRGFFIRRRRSGARPGPSGPGLELHLEVVEVFGPDVVPGPLTDCFEWRLRRSQELSKNTSGGAEGCGYLTRREGRAHHASCCLCDLMRRLPIYHQAIKVCQGRRDALTTVRSPLISPHLWLPRRGPSLCR